MSDVVDRWAVLEILRPVSDEERQRAARWVAESAPDAPAAAEVLAMLGLSAADGL